MIKYLKISVLSLTLCQKLTSFIKFNLSDYSKSAIHYINFKKCQKLMVYLIQKAELKQIFW